MGIGVLCLRDGERWTYLGITEMNELKITDALDRQLQPGNVVVLNVLMSGGHVFDGIYVIVSLEYFDNGDKWAIEVQRYRGLGGPTRRVVGDWFEGKCFGYGEMVLKLTESEAAL